MNLFHGTNTQYLQIPQLKPKHQQELKPKHQQELKPKPKHQQELKPKHQQPHIHYFKFKVVVIHHYI